MIVSLWINDLIVILDGWNFIVKVVWLFEILGEIFYCLVGWGEVRMYCFLIFVVCSIILILYFVNSNLLIRKVLDMIYGGD